MPKPQLSTEPTVVPVAVAKPEPKIELVHGSKATQKPEPKPESKIEPKTTLKPELKPERKTTPKPELKPETKLEPKVTPKPELKPEAKSEPKISVTKTPDSTPITGSVSAACVQYFLVCLSIHLCQSIFVYLYGFICVVFIVCFSSNVCKVYRVLSLCKSPFPLSLNIALQ